VNDQFFTEINGCEIYLEVESIDSITLLNGEKRKRLNFDDETESWVEGIGSTYGLLKVGWEQCAFDWYFELNCFTENGILKYDNPDFDGCYVITTGIDEKASGFLQLFPNPVGDFTEIKFPYKENNIYELRINDSYGKLVGTINNIHSGQVLVPTQNLKRGTYIIRLFENDKLRYTNKMIKQ
jgi:hypothetical protein